jgi:hypothetical protein
MVPQPQELSMRHSLVSLFVTAGLALGQTTGVPGINDYTINSLGSGTTSCTPLCFPGGGLTLNFQLSAPGGALGLVMINFCPCLACQLTAPTNACLPTIPSTACGSSNQSFDLDLSPPCGIPFTQVALPNSAGVLTVSIPIPSFTGIPCTNAVISTQAIVFDACGLGPYAVPGPFVLTQSFTIRF